VPGRFRAFTQPSDRPGSLGRLAHYEILEVLGQGGFGIVFRAFDVRLHRQVAIKLLGTSVGQAAARRRFLREARAAAAVRNDHVAAVYAVEERPAPYLVMEYVDGPTLQQRIDREGRLEPAEVLRLGEEIAAGLAAAHSRGVIHCDVKPGNVLLLHGRCAKIVDFGLARSQGHTDSPDSSLCSGTPLFMAPEQAQDDPLDPRTDLFSLGSVLYLACTGRLPFTGPSGLAVLQRVCEAAPTPIPQIAPDVPAWLCGVIGRLHARSPAGRFGSAQEVAELFARARAHLLRHGTLTGLPPVAAGPDRPVPPARHRGLKAPLALGLALALAVAAGVWAVISNRGKPQDEPAGLPAVVAPRDAWFERVSLMPAERQVEEVAARMRELNPGFDGAMRHEIEGGVVTGVDLSDKDVESLAPLRALTGLRRLNCNRTKAADLSPLKGLPLQRLECEGTPVTDLSPLKGMPLTFLNVAFTEVADLSPLAGMPMYDLNVSSMKKLTDLSPLKGMPLGRLWLDKSPVRDLLPLRGSPITHLTCEGTEVKDLSPVAGLPLVYFRCDFVAERDAILLRSIPTLKSINDVPTNEFLMSKGEK
jgi:hypothetical protein